MSVVFVVAVVECLAFASSWMMMVQMESVEVDCLLQMESVVDLQMESVVDLQTVSVGCCYHS